MKNTKEYNVIKTKAGGSTFYFIGNDFIIVDSNIICCRRRKIAILDDSIEDFIKRLDYIASNGLTITL